MYLLRSSSLAFLAVVMFTAQSIKAHGYHNFSHSELVHIAQVQSQQLSDLEGKMARAQLWAVAKGMGLGAAGTLVGLWCFGLTDIQLSKLFRGI